MLFYKLYLVCVSFEQYNNSCVYFSYSKFKLYNKQELYLSFFFVLMARNCTVSFIIFGRLAAKLNDMYTHYDVHKK